MLTCTGVDCVHWGHTLAVWPGIWGRPGAVSTQAIVRVSRDCSASHQDHVLSPHIEMVAEGAEGRQEGRHHHQDGDDGGDERVRAPLVRVNRGVLRTWETIKLAEMIIVFTFHRDSMGEPTVFVSNTCSQLTRTSSDWLLLLAVIAMFVVHFTHWKDNWAGEDKHYSGPSTEDCSESLHWDQPTISLGPLRSNVCLQGYTEILSHQLLSLISLFNSN